MNTRRKQVAFFLSFFIVASLLILGSKKADRERVVAPPNGGSGEPEIQALAGPPQEQSQSVSELNSGALLPDLGVKELSGAFIVVGANGQRILRFPGTFANTGDGPLELISEPDKETNTIQASQRIYKKDASKETRPVGNFVFHSTHDHWHFEDFVEFELHSLTNDGKLDQRLLSTGKMTFCIHDYGPLPDSFPGKPTEVVYPWCGSSVDIQGISVGWVDTYLADVPGQELDISEIPDGKYAFRSIVDPENRVVEKDENNNSTISFIEISGNNVRVLPGPAP